MQQEEAAGGVVPDPVRNRGIRNAHAHVGDPDVEADDDLAGERPRRLLHGRQGHDGAAGLGRWSDAIASWTRALDGEGTIARPVIEKKIADARSKIPR